MKRTDRILLFSWTAVVFATLLYMPWHVIAEDGHHFMGYDFLWTWMSRPYSTMEPDWSRLLVEWAMAASLLFSIRIVWSARAKE